MSDNSAIEWTDATWNPITGCTLESEGCRHCYAARLAATRLKHLPSREGLARVNAAGEAKFTGEVRFNREWLTQPLKWKRPRMIFVCAHGDLFAPNVPDEWIDQVFAVMALCPQHTFQVLTKRPERMRGYLSAARAHPVGLEALGITLEAHAAGKSDVGAGIILQGDIAHLKVWPLPNVWLGTSVEDQAAADKRIPALLATPAAVRFISAEPLLGFVDLTGIQPGGGVVMNALKGERFDVFDASGGEVREPTAKVHWVIVGGESGPGARPMLAASAMFLLRQCQAEHVPFFFKQWGEWIDADEWYEHVGRKGYQLRSGGKPWQPPQPLNFEAAGFLAQIYDREFQAQSDGTTMIRVGKTAAGRYLDGSEHNGMPRRPA